MKRRALPSLQEVRAERCRRSLAAFVRAAWHVIEPGTELIWGWHLEAIIAHLEAVERGEIKRLIINVPPGHMKSLLVCVFFPAWMWLKHPSWRSMWATYSSRLSLRDSSKFRDVVTSTWFKTWFAPDWGFARDQNAKGYIKNTAKGERMALTVGGDGTGLRGDCVGFDDPMNVEKGGYTPATLLTVRDWWDGRMSSRLNDMSTGVFIGIMQRLDVGDLVGHLTSRAGNGWVVLSLPSEFEPETRCSTPWFTDPRTEPGELLFPAKFPQKVLDDAKIDLGSDYDAQHQQRPSSMSGGIFKMNEIKFYYPSAGYEPEPWSTKLEDGTTFVHEQMAEPKYFTTDVQSWDLAFKKTESTDFVAGHVWSKRDSGFFLRDRFHDRASFVDSLDAFMAMTNKWPSATAKLVEDKANGPALMSMLDAKIQGIIPVEPDGGKIARANAVAPLFRAGNVYVPHPASCPWILDVLKEWCGFPRGSLNDDDVDAMTQALNYMRQDNEWFAQLGRR